MAFTSLKRILPQAVRHAGLESSVDAVRVVEEAGQILNRLWDTERAAYVRPISFKEGTLTIAVTSPSATHALRLIEPTWINEINRTLGERRVLKIVTRREGF